MLTKRYMTSVKNLSKIMEKIVEGTAPKKFTISLEPNGWTVMAFESRVRAVSLPPVALVR